MAQKTKVKFPIGLKLISMMALMLCVATMTVVTIASKLFIDDTTAFIQKSNSDVASQLATQVYSYLGNLTNVLSSMCEDQSHTKSLKARKKILKQDFSRNPEIVSVSTWDLNGKRLYFNLKPGTPDATKDLVKTLAPPPTAFEAQGRVDIERVSLGGKGMLSVSFPLVVTAAGQVIQAGVGLIEPEAFLRMFGKKGVVTSYLVDSHGTVLAHPDKELVTAGASLKDVAIVKAMLESPINNNQMRFTEADGTALLGAFRQVGVGGVGVVSQVHEDKAFATAKRVQYRSLLVSGIILFLAFGVVFFFSSSLTKPIHSLMNLTAEIASGNFEVKIQPRGNDEITELTRAFGSMTDGLKERDKVKSLFGKFHGSDIADQLMNGEVTLGGEQRVATVFFSDIRGFTSFSEKIKPGEVVEMLNEYFKIMVAIIQKHHGVVDKFIGDAIMAVWGAPKSTGHDCENAIKACLEMRTALEHFNASRKERGLPVILVGMGVHTGDLIAGTIGSDDRMEYTVIGDAVNTAARIEASTKAYGTDLLISGEIVDQVKEQFLIEKAGQAEVKGKSEPLRLFKVNGYVDASGKEVIVKTPYSSYKAEKADKVKTA